MWSSAGAPDDRLAVSRWIAASVTIRSAAPSPVVSTSTNTTSGGKTSGGKTCAAATAILRHEPGKVSRAASDPARFGPRYSTVTDFARLRGWSTSFPMKTAVW
ncbi:hypothetical protein JCM2811A_41350 [Methylorubrum rhodinum]